MAASGLAGAEHAAQETCRSFGRCASSRSKAWRITCPACGGAFTDTSEHRSSRATSFETTPFDDVWSEATEGERIVETSLGYWQATEHSLKAILQLLLVQIWKPATGDIEHPAVGWVLGTLFPKYERRAQPIKQNVTHAAITTLPIEFRPA